MNATALKTLAAAALALGLAGSEAAAQVNIGIRLPGPAIRTPVPTQPVRLPYPQIPVKPLPTQFNLPVQPVVLPKVELPPIVVPAQPRVITPGQTGPAPVAVLIENALKDQKAPKDAVLAKVFDGIAAGTEPQSDPVDLRDEKDLPEEPRTQPTRRVTLPEWELEQDLGIR